MTREELEAIVNEDPYAPVDPVRCADIALRLAEALEKLSLAWKSYLEVRNDLQCDRNECQTKYGWLVEADNAACALLVELEGEDDDSDRSG